MRAAALVVLSVAAAGAPAAGPEPVVPAVRDAVQPQIDRHLAEVQKATRQEQAAADRVTARLKPPLRQRGVADPWGALAELERRGLDLAAAAGRGLKGLPETVGRMDRLLDRAPAEPAPAPAGEPQTIEDHVRHIAAVLDAAAGLREQAVARLAARDRAFVFDRAAALAREFRPQAALTDRTRARLRDDLAFVTLWEEAVDRPALAAATRTLLRLTDPAYLDALRRALATAPARPGKPPDGMTGEVLAVRETRHGLIVFGGGKANAYDVRRPVAFLADLGGDDTYKGVVASSFDPGHPFGLVIDFAGNDVYRPADLGLGTGRLGCGCLVDRGGDDTYVLPAGAGGCGFAGVGLLVDEAGRDSYAGGRFGLGAAVCGVGLLLDAAGNDTYSGAEYALGLGGPGGVGAVIDVAGDDRYRCGFQLGSGYNSTDAPTAKPGDPHFQYDAFGLGVGLGRRTYPFSEEGDRFNLAGGVGVWLDLAGDDHSDSSNFSQACGYFFGIGLKLDLAGSDRHVAARYGHAAGVHYGMAAALDYGGDDTHVAAGPVYNAACAWDRSVCLFADGRGDDIYDLTRSTGCGRADRGGWSVFADLGGKDRYRAAGPFGGAAEKGLGVFFDGGGEDEYPTAAAAAFRNGTAGPTAGGGLFVDR